MTVVIGTVAFVGAAVELVGASVAAVVVVFAIVVGTGVVVAFVGGRVVAVAGVVALAVELSAQRQTATIEIMMKTLKDSILIDASIQKGERRDVMLVWLIT